MESLITCTRRLQFCAGHRVVGHESKCRNIHGHNYTVLVEASGNLDSVGRVIDFGILKEVYSPFLDSSWDHRLLLWEQDPLLDKLLRIDPAVRTVPFNPTAENMAKYLLDYGQHALKDVTVSAVTVWETENCFAVARRKEGE